MSPIGEDHVYVVPIKEVHSNQDMDKWTKSDAYQEFVGFIESLNAAVKGKTLSAPLTRSPVVTSMVDMIEGMDKLIDDTPLIDQPQRFGNKAFATFYHKLVDQIKPLLTSALPEKFHSAINEISVYVTESVGNSTRIDYGSGHELSFVMFLYCLFRIGALDCNSVDDRAAAVLVIFNRYLNLVRKLQTKYKMEPAGSHGVWSLDDFQFVPFIWGSSQFAGNPRIEPSQFADESLVEQLASEYMFMGCIQYILEVKSGPFYEHSNQLYNISGTQSWQKVNQGLIKMYKGEVLGKFPVVQHMLFGSLLSISEFDATKKGMSMSGPNAAGRGIRHGPNLEGQGLAALRNLPPPPTLKPPET